MIGHTGRGNYGHGLDLAFTGLPGVDLVAVADAGDAGRQRALARTGAARAYASYQEMLEREQLDLVAVAPTDLDQREAMVVAAAQSGARAIYCEKPLARSLDEADRMLAACDARGVKIAVAHQNRAFPAPWLVRTLITQGKLGRLRVMRAWPKQDRRGGGLELLIHGTHMFDLMRLFAGNARWCHAHVSVEGRDITAADSRPGLYAAGPIAGDDLFATFGFEGGVTGQFESMQSDDGGGSEYLRMEVGGTAGTLAFWSALTSPVYFVPRPFPLPGATSEWERLPLDAPAEASMEAPAEASMKAPAVPAGASELHAGNQALVRDLLAAVEEDRPPMASGHDARAALEMIVAVYESHIRGERVTLPLEPRTHPLTRWRESRTALERRPALEGV